MTLEPRHDEGSSRKDGFSLLALMGVSSAFPFPPTCLGFPYGLF